jgi:gamma-glutamylputrescine oxidase
MGWQYQYYNEGETPDIIGSKGYHAAVRYEDTYGVDPLQYAQGMKNVLLNLGVEIFEASEVIHLDGHTVHTHLGSVKAKQIIFCIDKLEEKLSPLAWQAYHAQTFLSISEPLSQTEVQDLFPSGKMQCWDTDLVYSYYRLTGDNRLLLGGGSALTTFSREDTHSPFVINGVHKKFKAKFPFLENLHFVQYWPGRIDTTRDLLPVVARERERPWLHCSLGSVGLPWGTFCGDFVARHALGNEIDDARFYQYFTAGRQFLVPLWLEQVVGKQLTFSLNNWYAKYRQVDSIHIDVKEKVF